jgi:alkanesulfonate monooxygenase SsuD/methylene tetrahydromethanopterin reductase-like flavin-dependent oxidoreductase (luciferase family)
MMAGFNIFAADSDEEAELLASSQAQSFVALRTGNPRQLPPPVAGYRESLGAQGSAILDHVLQCSAVGGPAKVAREISAFIERTGVDELMIASAIYDHGARKRSLAITADVMRELKVAA